MSKGQDYERVFCRRLSLWWSKGEHDDLFWRTSQSGGRATTRKKSDKSTSGHYGDVSATDPSAYPLLSKVVIELKKGYNNITLADLFEASSDRRINHQYSKWIVKARVDAKMAKTPFWWIVHKRDRKPDLICFPHEMPWSHIKAFKPDYIHFKIGKCELIQMKLDEFFAIAAPLAFKGKR